MVSLVQVAATLPLCLFALPAGALADIVDTRRFLIGAECFITAAATLLAVMVWLDQVTPATLLLFTFLVETGFAVTSPAWQSIVPQLVPRVDLPPAVAMNSVGVNISRALGPAAAGVLTSGFGIAAPFWVNAVANLGSIGALTWWRPAPRHESRLPAERFVGAMSAGLRHARYNRPLRVTLLRAIGFFLFASCYWALLPLVARSQMSGGATLYGLLLGGIGASAIAGALALPRLERIVGANRLVAAGAIGTAVALALYGIARDPATALAASLVAGFSWVAVLATLNVSAQFALAEWVRARGLAVYVTVAFGAMTLGSVLWGEIARHAGVAIAHLIAAVGALLAGLATWRWKPQSGAALDLTPSLHWPTPIVGTAVALDDGPVLVSIEYRVAVTEHGAFLEALRALSHARRRDGAYAWGAFQDVGVPDRVVEVFMVESWAEHLRQHERVTNADRILEDRMRRLLTSEPTVTHLIAAREAIGD
jgi:MFS family permease